MVKLDTCVASLLFGAAVLGAIMLDSPHARGLPEAIILAEIDSVVGWAECILCSPTFPEYV